MIEKSIYIITKTTGDYEDRVTELIKAKTTKDSANLFIQEQIKKYEDIPKISERWEFWEKKIFDLVENDKKTLNPKTGKLEVEDKDYEDTMEKYMGTLENFLKYLKNYFPEDFNNFGKDKLSFAFDLEERGQLDEFAWYDVEEIILEDD